MNFDMWKFIARDDDYNSECWVFTDEPEYIDNGWDWSAGHAARCDFAIPVDYWPAPGECRRITRFEIVLETEAMD
jgi:hypothetical protein